MAWQLFDDLLNNTGTRITNVATGLDQMLGSPTNAFVPAGRAEALGKGLGSFVNTASKLNPLLLASGSIATALNPDEGPIPAVAEAAGTIAGAKFAVPGLLQAAQAIPNPYVKGGAMLLAGIGAPLLAGQAAKAVVGQPVKGAVDAVSGSLQKGASNAVNNAVNPSAPSNVMGSALDKQMEVIEAINKQYGAERAAQYAAQIGMLDALTDNYERRASIDAANSARLSPLVLNRELANTNTIGLNNMANTIAQGTANSAQAIYSAPNAYAQYVLG